MHPYFQRFSRSTQRLVFFWHKYGGLSGSVRKVYNYLRTFGLRALFYRASSIALGAPKSRDLRRATAVTAKDNSGTVTLVPVEAASFKTSDRVCIHIHLFYADLAEEFCQHLEHMPCAYTLLVSVVTAEAEHSARQVFAKLSQCRELVIKVVENRGRDMGPFFCAFGTEVARHDFVAHFHSKKSLQMDGAGNLWRKYMLGALLGAKDDIAGILDMFKQDEKLGLVYPQTFHGIPCMAHHWLANRVRCEQLLIRLGYAFPGDIMFDYPVGSMFWARTEALRPLLELGFSLQDFDAEAGQLDGTLAHALERLMGMVPALDGYSHAVLRMEDNPQKHRWGLDQCHDLAWALNEVITTRNVRLVIFDIFDTLLLRPVWNPEDTKKLTALRLNEEDARHYSTWRVGAEEEARRREGVDVNLDQIFVVLADLAGISQERALHMRDTEAAVELAAVSANTPACDLVRLARQKGARVVYASDMFLPREVIEQMLHTAGVPAPEHLYLSNELNLRKDSGAMYPHILEQEGVSVYEAAMVGDNIRSDIQIPSDMGMLAYPAVRATDLLRAAPAFAAFVMEPFTRIEDSLSAGLMLRYLRLRARPLDILDPLGPFQDFQGIGYTILGPVLTGFAAWVAEEATRRGIDKLCFLARDGKIMRHAYEAWRSGTGEGPPSIYLEVSRRAVSMPNLHDFEDLMDLLCLPFKGTDCRTLFQERVGLEITDAEKTELEAKGLWPDFSIEDEEEASPLKESRQLRKVAEHFWPRIRQMAEEERAGAHAYFASRGLDSTQKLGFVDVGYSGTIQRHCARLLNQPLLGFYLLTGNAVLEKSTDVTDMLGYIGENCTPANPHMVVSFRMERLLSASEGQVVSYAAREGQEPEVARRPFSAEEQQYDAARAQLQEGLEAFVADALRVRSDLYAAFVPSRPVASAAWLLLEGLKELDPELKLDDFYHSGSII